MLQPNSWNSFQVMTNRMTDATAITHGTAMRKGCTPRIVISRCVARLLTWPGLEVKRRGEGSGNNGIMDLLDLNCRIYQHCSLEEIEANDLRCLSERYSCKGST